MDGSDASDALSTVNSEQFNDHQSYLSSNIVVTQPLTSATPSIASVSVSSSLTTGILKPSRKLRTSAIWDYTKVGRFDLVLNIHGKETWNCKFCSREYVISGGTNIIISHLKTSHNISVKAAKDLRTNIYENTIKAAFAKPQSVKHKRRRLDNTNSSIALDPKVLKELYV